MGSSNDNFIIPLGIDTAGLLTGFDQIEEKLSLVTKQAKGATTAMSEAFASTTKNGDVLSQKMAAGAQSAKTLQDAAKAAGTEVDKIFTPTSKDEALRTQLINIKNELAQLSLAGKEGTQRFSDLETKARTLGLQYKATQELVSSLSQKHLALNATMEGARGMAALLSLTTGAMATFGEADEETQKKVEKLFGAMAILSGITEISNVLHKDSAFMVYLASFAHKAHTEAVIADTAAVAGDTIAKEGEVAATVAATAATEGWTAALLANPLVAIVALLSVAALGFYEFSKSQKEAGLSAEQFNKILEQQQGFLEEDLAIASRRAAVSEAEATAEGKNQSRLQEIRLNALKEQKLINQQAFEELSANQEKLDSSNKDYAKNKEALDKKLEENEKTRQSLNSQIGIEEIKLQTEQLQEQLILQENFLKERQNEVTKELAIAKQAKDLINQIALAKIGELKDSEEKELLLLKNSFVQKTQQLDNDSKARLTDLNNQKNVLAASFELADENGKKLISLQLSNINKQIALEQQNGETLKRLKVTLTEAEQVEETKIVEKYAQQRADIEFKVATTLIQIQKESATQKIDIINLTAKHEADIIERSSQNTLTKNLQLDEIEKKRLKDINDATLEFTLKEIDIEKTANENKIIEQKGFFDQSRDAQALGQLLLLQNQLEADEKKLKALVDAGKKEGDQEYENAKNAVIRSKAGVEQAMKDSKPQDIFELLFPGSSKNQANAKLFMTTLDSVGKAVQSYTSLVIAQYQKQVDAQKAVVKSDDDQLATLADQLKTQQSLKDKGLANNVDGVRKEIAEKNKQRDLDIQKQDEYQKKLEKIQKAQIAAQTALQAVQLLTASTNILLKATSEGGAVGAIIGSIAVAGMIAAFIAEKAAAYEAVSAPTKLAEGGMIKGRSHSMGGQKYFAPDASGGVLELEDGEQVINKKSTEKYFPLLQVINDDKLGSMNDGSILQLLQGLGVHLENSSTHKDALKESREHTTNAILQQFHFSGNTETPKELISIDKNIQKLTSEKEVITEEGEYTVIRKGNFTRKIKKHQ